MRLRMMGTLEIVISLLPEIQRHEVTREVDIRTRGRNKGLASFVIIVLNVAAFDLFGQRVDRDFLLENTGTRHNSMRTLQNMNKLD